MSVLIGWALGAHTVGKKKNNKELHMRAAADTPAHTPSTRLQLIRLCT